VRREVDGRLELWREVDVESVGSVGRVVVDVTILIAVVV